MKKKLLFVIDSLHCAGAEKSLVTLLSLLDFDVYDVDLMLFAHGGMLEKLVPEKVKILPPLAYSAFARLPLKKAVHYAVRHSAYRMLAARLKYTFAIRMRHYSNPEKARIFWQTAGKVIGQLPGTYDIAISYAQGVPTFYVADKVKAKKKFAWVNVSYRLNEKERKFQDLFYQQYNKVVAVSHTTRTIFLQTFPKIVQRMTVIYDIHNPVFIRKMAAAGAGYEDGFKGIRILTIGRLAHQKGYDIALSACKILKEKGIFFRWYVLGKGELEKQIVAEIKKNHLEDCFILLGVTANPYPFIKNADLYVQTSKYEGFGLAVAEARMLDIPVVTTRFDAVYNQMIHGKNGLITDMNGKAVSEAIEKLLKNQQLKQSIVEYLQKEQKGNIHEIKKLYQLIDGV
ncbi:glycosyltransferase [Bacillaceae bacterium Marseille-Q3522]|nr:glycosyltransferase [Bacillaceae bacterium Marseille-Q3522]